MSQPVNQNSQPLPPVNIVPPPAQSGNQNIAPNSNNVFQPLSTQSSNSGMQSFSNQSSVLAPATLADLMGAYDRKNHQWIRATTNQPSVSQSSGPLKYPGYNTTVSEKAKYH